MPKWACQTLISEEDFLAGSCACPVEASDPVSEWLDAASDILYVLSGGAVFGVCTRTVRPVFDDCLPGCGPRYGTFDSYERWAPYHWAQYGGQPPLRLRGPATVIEVKIDGVVLAPSSYALVDGRDLIRRDGLRWPIVNNLTQPDSQANTWSVTFSFGSAPDAIVRMAMQELACDLASSDGVLRRAGFPPGVVAANVQGASVVIEDASDASLPNVARFLSIYGPAAQGGVYSPEIDTPYRLVDVAYPV